MGHAIRSAWIPFLTPKAPNLKLHAFVAMPFGTKPDAAGNPVDFNAVYDDLILLLRAAIVRARPERARHILVVCPSGMATTQLLVARLRARFPRLGTFEVLPMREITTSRVANADLIISTVPLILPDDAYIDVIQVHPMLRADDIVRLTQWMA